MIRKLLATLALTGVVLGTAGGNTVKGRGRDIEAVGEAGDKVVR